MTLPFMRSVPLMEYLEVLLFVITDIAVGVSLSPYYNLYLDSVGLRVFIFNFSLILSCFPQRCSYFVLPPTLFPHTLAYTKYWQYFHFC